jgi:hypothetical protein
MRQLYPMKFNLAFALLVLCLTIKTSNGQMPPELSDRSTAQLVNDAFSNSYGRLLVTEFGKILRESAATDCLRNSPLDGSPVEFEERGKEILIKNGIRVMEVYEQGINTAKYRAAFIAQIGPNATKEFALLLANADVKKLNELRYAARLATVAHAVTETIGRQALVNRLGLVRSPSPYMAGKPELWDASELALSQDISDRFAERHPTPQVLRWEKMGEAMTDAFKLAFDQNKPFHAGPSYLVKDLAEGFAKVCVFPVSQQKQPVAPNPTSR